MDRRKRHEGAQLLQRSTPRNDVDMFVYEPFEFDTEYAAVMQGALLPGLYARFVSIPALIRMKEAANCPRDLDDIQHLRWILEDQNG